ncbi:hypothetical protein Ga0074812_12458 [Parafrankia irregularis]|uniref:DUF779 domain-containing protein n=1 Tax=Parafrankia irregularis TaxID=795642 RepID=A0A0S4QUY7_9ACTN|nr:MULTISPECIES: DUF779 domain-containing protein [Parafrankia]MBE3203725.1 DUF779 domain-containing protein [Parafrankia sp. CH37]CUU59033.1 hypothetical protein Ga0074812_12458 [Parafrankia irregularis]
MHQESTDSADSTDVTRVDATPAALAMLRRLAQEHGPLMIHQSGGCCDGSSPMCFPRGEFLVGDSDVLLGVIGVGKDVAPGDAVPGEGVPVYIGAAQFEYWSHTHLTIDLVPGRGAGFSLEAPEGYRFLTRSRLLTDEEAAQPAAQLPAPGTVPGD